MKNDLYEIIGTKKDKPDLKLALYPFELTNIKKFDLTY